VADAGGEGADTAAIGLRVEDGIHAGRTGSHRGWRGRKLEASSFSAQRMHVLA
jgi:hypothetical protein